ncbi:nucleoside hydrolase [Paenibacillus sp. 5J-6]|uniref:Nucleoside hydrolase n=1 Tax=Paenibacillus silvestris TaxID=2606219 RepID=A0A6L8VCE4_9BACL|nr:nucleoside hydrolase [Paenibacillus silvestris]MZQ86870.1 nucleoside hydrolase [Paenibacillus silvestris]
MITFLPYEVPESKRIRLIINTDAKNEADDQFAIVHALLTPRFVNKGIIAAHFGTERTLTSMEDSYEECEKILSLMEMKEVVPLYRGAERAMTDERTPALSEGAEFIIREAMKEDAMPLYVISLGAITDLASALLIEPRIADRLTAIWIGGGQWPEGEREFNLSNDIAAANSVMASSVPLWVVPRNVYSTIRVSLAELALKVRPYGPIGSYLFEQMVDFNHTAAGNPRFPKGEMWSLGDSPAVSLLLDSHEYAYEMKPAPRITQDMRYVHYQKERFIRWYNEVDARFTLEDMFAKIALYDAYKK